MNIFAEMIHSVRSIKSYKDFLKNSMPRTLLYGLLLSVFYVILALVLPVMIMLVPLGGIEKMVIEGIPDFALKDGILWMEEPVEYKQYNQLQGGMYMMIDTDNPVTEQISNVDLLAFDQAVVLDAANAVIKTNGEVIRFSYAELNLGDWDKEKVVNELMPYIRAGIWMVMLFVLWFSLISFFIGALLLALVGSIMSGILNCGMRFGELFRLAVHARTASILVKIIFSWLPVVVPFFTVISFGISAVYMWKALKDIRKDSVAE